MSSGAFQPRNEAELAETIRGASAERRPVRLSGGGLVARRADDSALGVWMAGISGVTSIREGDLVAAARAGTSLWELNGELAERRLRFPLRPHDAGDRATVGGVFAAAADGLRARLGFRARDLLLGARAVLATGERVFVGANVVKSVAGFDVCKAFVGSRGCLAAITELTVRVESVPEAEATLAGDFAAETETVAAVAAADALPLAPAGLVVTPRDEGFHVEALVEGPRAAVAAAAKRLEGAGFAEAPGDWATATAFAALPPPTGHRRVVRPARRTAPLADVPRDAVSFVVDVLRGRSYAHVPGAEEEAAALDPLAERLRAALDPERTFAPGWGLFRP